jgi:hypothetical protein
MKSRFDFDREGAATGNSVRTLVATLCVLGLVGLTFLHIGDGGWFAAEATLPATDGPVATSAGSLHAPTSDPSLPSLEATFSRKDVTPADEAPAPTF